MKIFIDSATPKEVGQAFDTGIVDGVTTNPSLVAKTGKNFTETVKEICNIASNCPVSVEVPSVDYNSMLLEGQKILDISDNIVLKLPTTPSGIKVCKYFSAKGRDTNMTLCFSTSQFLLAAKAGATYVSPFVGRLDDIGEEGTDLLDKIKNICLNYPEYKAQILAASIRNILHFNKAVQIGVDAITIPSTLMYKLMDHHLTESGLKRFVEDWQSSGLKI